MYFVSLNLINRFPTIKPKPVVRSTSESATKMKSGADTDISALEIQLTKKSANMPKKKLAAFDNEVASAKT